MKVLDYILRDRKDRVIYDEAGNLYLTTLHPYEADELLIPMTDIGDDTLFISKEDCDKWNQFEITIDEEAYIGIARRPYYRMRGKPVTREQAFDIIRRTDFFFSCIDEVCGHEDYIGSMNFPNWLINKNHYPRGYGWIHADGTVGGNAITGKYPEIHEFIEEWMRNLICFSYLDLVIAVTDWDEIPHEVWHMDYDDDFRCNQRWEYESYDKNFYDAVVLGIHVHDKKVEILGSSEAVKRYKEYAALYEKGREVYIPEYYQEHNIVQVTLEDIKRCIEAYGLDADAVLQKTPENWWRG